MFQHGHTTMFPNAWQSLPSKVTQEFLETATAAHSVPWSKPTFSNDKPNLLQIQSLEECFQLLTDMAMEVDDISKGINQRALDRYRNVSEKDSEPTDMESSKSIILSWGKELDRLNMSRGATKKASTKAEHTEMTTKDVFDISKDSERIMNWAHELQTITEVRNKI